MLFFLYILTNDVTARLGFDPAEWVPVHDSLRVLSLAEEEEMQWRTIDQAVFT